MKKAKALASGLLAVSGLTALVTAVSMLDEKMIAVGVFIIIWILISWVIYLATRTE